MIKVLKPVLIFGIFALLFVGFFHEINAITQDLGRHFINGQIIVTSGRIPLTNYFSFTAPNFPFINHHWFSEVIFYIIASQTGFNGLLIFATSIILMAFGLIYFYSLKKDNLIPLTIASLLYFGILFERTDLRPEIISFLFLAIFIIILYRYREKFTLWIFVLPFIELVWVNTHIYFFLGLCVLGFFLIDSFIKNIIPIVVWIDKRGKFPKETFILAIVFFISFFLILINPNGFNGAFYPLKVFENYGYPIEENQNIFFLWQTYQKPTIPYFFTAVFLLSASLAIFFKKTKPVDWMISLFFIILGVIAVRNFPIFVFGTFVIFNCYFSKIYQNIISYLDKGVKNLDLNKENSFSSSLLIICLIVIIIFSMKNVLSRRDFGMNLEKGASNAATYFLSNKIKGPIFNNFDIGSYLDYRFYNQEKVFVDGRPEAYPADFFSNVYIPMQQDKKVFEQITNKYNINSIFFAHTDQTPWANEFLAQIIKNPGWKMAYLDDYVVIFLKDNLKNKDLIKKLEINQNQINVDQITKGNFNALLRLGNFFIKTNNLNQQAVIHQKILEIKPEFCPSLLGLASFYSNQNMALNSIYVNRFKQNCQ